MLGLFALAKYDNIPHDSITSIQYQPLTLEVSVEYLTEVHKLIGDRHGWDPEMKDAFEE